MTYVTIRSRGEWWIYVGEITRAFAPGQHLEHRGSPKAFPCRVETRFGWSNDTRPVLVATHVVRPATGLSAAA